MTIGRILFELKIPKVDGRPLAPVSPIRTVTEQKTLVVKNPLCKKSPAVRLQLQFTKLLHIVTYYSKLILCYLNFYSKI